MRKILSLVIFLFSFVLLIGQEEKKPVELAAFVISADNSLDVEDFMQKVLIDSSFYQAFINLKYIPHDLRSTLFVRNKGEKQKGKLDRTATQRLENEHRVVEILSEESNGRIYKKNGYHRYLTAEMYDEVFFPAEPEKVAPDIKSFEQVEIKGSKFDKYKSQLKKMMFNPGQEIVSVPFIGDKMDIFSEDMIGYYDFSIYSAYTDDSVYCHVFQVDVKDGVKSNKTVIKKMTSYFDKESMNVMSREYRLVNNTLLFEFDIWMKVENDFRGDKLLPRRIQYNGDWDVPFKGAEIINFDIRCRNYDLSVFR